MLPAPLSLRPGRALLVMVILSLILSCGCISGQDHQYEGTSTSIAPLPAPSEETARALEDIVEHGLEMTGAPGVLAGIDTPAWTWRYAAGNASLSPQTAATPDMRFIIASVTKPFTATAILKLSEAGILSLNDTIDRWLPEEVAEQIANSSEITIYQLLDHTSGIADYNEEEIIAIEYTDPDTPVPYQYGMWQGINAGPLFEQGTGYEYSNVNYILLTLIIDKAAQTPYEDYVTRKILVPASLNHTFIHRTNDIPGPTMGCPGDEYINGELPDYSGLYLQFDRGAGDIVSTTADLNTFHRLLEEGKIIHRSSLEEMKIINDVTLYDTDVFGIPADMGYGLGYDRIRIPSLNTTLRGHAGGYPGSYTMWFYWEEKETALTINVNSFGKKEEADREILIPLLTYLNEEI